MPIYAGSYFSPRLISGTSWGISVFVKEMDRHVCQFLWFVHVDLVARLVDDLQSGVWQPLTAQLAGLRRQR